MKLFARYNRINIAVTIVIFILGSILFYISLRHILIRQLDETLRGEMQEITGAVQAHGRLPEIQNTRQQWTTIESVGQPFQEIKIRHIPWYNEREHEQEIVRQLVFPLTAEGKWYKVTVSKSEVETEYQLKLIIGLTIGMIGLILSCNYVINRYVLKRLWQPFYQSIQSIHQYKLSSNQPLQLPRGEIEEINILNQSLNEMSSSINRDYLALKSFTENASHEMQTPLAVIRTHTDLLLQHSEWSEQDLQHLHFIEASTQRLAKLHQSLLLITKLENRQFVLTEQVDMEEVLNDYVSGIREWAEDRQIRISLEAEPTVILFHRHLAEILIANLLNNALRYTPARGRIHVNLSPRSLAILNTAANGALNKESIFQRFYKADSGTESTGLGLAIVKEICTLTKFTVEYDFLNGEHRFTIKFSHDKIDP